MTCRDMFSRAIIPVTLAALAAMVSTAIPAAAQETDLPVRLPADGLPVIDCAPPDPAPQDSCLLRIPSDRTLADVSSRNLGEEEADFRIVRNDQSLPDGLTLSATLVLVDLSKGPGDGRLDSWAAERELIRRLVRGLPQEGDLAIYSFGADLRRQSGFSQDRSAALEAIERIDLTENNTILGTNVADAIAILAERDDALLKNLIIVTDGDEEGVGDFRTIHSAAADAGVTLTGVGMFWRAEGNADTSRGIDVLRRMIEPANGLSLRAFPREQAEAEAAVDAFLNSYARSIGRSGVILPRDVPAAAEITVVLNAPVTGVAGQTREESYSVRFSPVAAAAAPPAEPEPEPEAATIFGLPALYVYAGAAFLLLALLAAGLLLRRREEPEPQDSDVGGAFEDPLDGNDDLEAADFDPVPEPKAAEAAPLPPVAAYLVRSDSGQRLPLRGDRIAIGRAASNGVVMPDQGISRVHAELHRNRDGGFSITDLDSLNGTFVNDKKITGTVAVRIGDSLGFGKIRTKLVLP